MIDNYSKYHKRTGLLSGGGISSTLELDKLLTIIQYSKMRITQIYSEQSNLWTVPLSVKKYDRVKFNFNPLTILSENIGSKIGLKNVVNYLSQKYFKNDRYNIVLCDTNIFWRLCKKYYENPKPLSFFRPLPILGLWHPGKMLVECVWRNYLSIILAQAFHTLYPNNNILYKVRLSHSMELFIQIYLALNPGIGKILFQKFLRLIDIILK